MSDINFCKNCQEIRPVTDFVCDGCGENICLICGWTDSAPCFVCDGCGENICLICGWTDSAPCVDILRDSCSWERPGVCSECAEEERAMKSNALRGGMKL